jgi:hypothetical protein
MQHESVFLLVLPSGAGGCLRCTSVVEARARARSVTRPGWLFHYITPPQPSERLPGSAVSKLELIETFGRPDPAALTRALQHVGKRLNFRFEITHSRRLTAATLSPVSSPEPWTSCAIG